MDKTMDKTMIILIIAIAVLAPLASGASLAGNYTVISEFPPECGCGFVGNISVEGSAGKYEVYFTIAGTTCATDRHVGDASLVPGVAEAYEIPSQNDSYVYLVATEPGFMAIINSGYPYCAGIAVAN